MTLQLTIQPYNTDTQTLNIKHQLEKAVAKLQTVTLITSTDTHTCIRFLFLRSFSLVPEKYIWWHAMWAIKCKAMKVGTWCSPLLVCLCYNCHNWCLMPLPDATCRSSILHYCYYDLHFGMCNGCVSVTQLYSSKQVRIYGRREERRERERERERRKIKNSQWETEHLRCTQ